MISESIHQIDDKIEWHKTKLELAEAKLHYHQEQLSNLLAFKANNNHDSKSPSH